MYCPMRVGTGVWYMSQFWDTYQTPVPTTKKQPQPHIRAAVIFYPGAQVIPDARNMLIISGEYD